MNLHFKPLTTTDLSAYRLIRMECLRTNPDYFGTEWEDEEKSVSLKFDSVLIQPNGEDFLMGAFLNEALIGIAGFIREKRTKSRHRGEITQMYVTQSFAGQGIGLSLLQSVLDTAFADETLEQIKLSVVDTNESAIRLYQKAGFNSCGLLEHYFKKENQYWGLLLMTLSRETHQSRINAKIR